MRRPDISMSTTRRGSSKTFRRHAGIVGDAIDLDSADFERRTTDMSILRDVSVASVIKFLRAITFMKTPLTSMPHSSSAISRDKTTRVSSSSWNIALMCGEPRATRGLRFRSWVRHRHDPSVPAHCRSAGYADIKTLMSRSIESSTSRHLPSQARRESETSLMHRRGVGEPRIVALYPIDRRRSQTRRKIANQALGRRSLMLSASALVFPGERRRGGRQVHERRPFSPRDQQPMISSSRRTRGPRV